MYVSNWLLPSVDLRLLSAEGAAAHLPSPLGLDLSPITLCPLSKRTDGRLLSQWLEQMSKMALCLEVFLHRVPAALHIGMRHLACITSFTRKRPNSTPNLVSSSVYDDGNSYATIAIIPHDFAVMSSASIGCKGAKSRPPTDHA